MSNPTSNFGWQMPTPTDLVTDLPADFEVFGQAVDSSMADLKGGTSGQILSKATNTDMDFTWVDMNPGDITGVTAGTGISGGGTSGTVTVTNSMATAIDAKGDLIGGTGADTFARLAVGANNTVLTADSTTATGLKWATPAAGGKILQVVQATYSTSTTVATTTLTDTGLSASITPTSSTSKILIFVNQAMYMTRSAGDFGMGMAILRGATSIFAPAPNYVENLFINLGTGVTNAGMILPMTYLDSPATTSATTYKIQGRPQVTSGSGSVTFQWNSGISTITLMEVAA